VIIFRDYFVGHRFPVLSFYYFPKENNSQNNNNNVNPSLPHLSTSTQRSGGVWILRSGRLLNDDLDLKQLIHCNYPSSVNYSSKGYQQRLFLKHIKLSYANKFSELKETIKQQVDWCTPKRSYIQQSWIQLKNLIHLSQIHTPDVEISTDFYTNNTASDHNNNNSYSSAENSPSGVLEYSLFSNEDSNHHNEDNNNNTNNNCPDTVYMNWDTLSTDSLGSEEQEKKTMKVKNKDIGIVLRRKLRSSEEKRYSTRSDMPRFDFSSPTNNSGNNDNTNNSISIGSNISKSLGRNYSRLNLLNKKKLESMAFQCSPHRSYWSENLLSTNWLDLLSFILKQANELVGVIYQYSIQPVNGYNGTIILLSGPDSGRNWQPILTSLAQVGRWICDFFSVCLD
ncbi:unnamed protein product, partial [Trichobilharzia regenti]